MKIDELVLVGRDFKGMSERGVLKAQIKQEMKNCVNFCISDQLIHAEVLAAGPFDFRRVFTKQMHTLFTKDLGSCDHVANVCFGCIELAWTEKYGTEITPKYFLDHVIVHSEPTEAEIEDAWEIEIASDERSMAQHYEGSRRTRKGKDLGSKRPH